MRIVTYYSRVLFETRIHPSHRWVSHYQTQPVDAILRLFGMLEEHHGNIRDCSLVGPIPSETASVDRAEKFI
jgi:hypothetical protein